MSLIIAVFHQAGGVGKSTGVKNLEYQLSQRRYRFIRIIPYPDSGLETALTVLLQVWVPSVFSQKLGYLALIAQSR